MSTNEAPPAGLSNGTLATYELLQKLDKRLASIEGRLSTLETAKAPKQLNVTQLVSQIIAGSISLTVVVGAVFGSIDVSVALAFAGGLAFSLPGLVTRGQS